MTHSWENMASDGDGENVHHEDIIIFSSPLVTS
jgi:hypothetical protein